MPSWCAQNNSETGSKTKQKKGKKIRRGQEKQSRDRSGKKNYPLGNYRLRRAERWEYIATVACRQIEVSLCIIRERVEYKITPAGVCCLRL